MSQSLPACEVFAAVERKSCRFCTLSQDLPSATRVQNWQSPGVSTAGNMRLDSTDECVIKFVDVEASTAPDPLKRLQARYRDPPITGIAGVERCAGWLVELSQKSTRIQGMAPYVFTVSGRPCDVPWDEDTD